MKEDKRVSRAGIGFCGLLTIVFIVLKLIGVIDWSWLWVLSPVWIPFAFSVLFIGIVLIAAWIRKKVK